MQNLKHKKWIFRANMDMNSFLFNLYRQQFIHKLIKQGHKLFAYKFFIQLLYLLKIDRDTKNINPWYIFLGAMLNLTPKVMLYKINLGGAKKLIPFPITLKNKIGFSVKWTIKFLIKHKKPVTIKSLVTLLVGAFFKKGPSFRQKQIFNKIALQNRALIRYFK